MPRKRHPAKYDAKRKEWSRIQRHALPASGTREEARLAAEDRFYRQLVKEREIGVYPMHFHSSHRAFFDRNAWLKRSREWDQNHG